MQQLYAFLGSVLRAVYRYSFSVVLPAMFFFAPLAAFGQQNAGLGTTTPNASALLDMTSTTQGLLVPRMTTGQRTSISSPANGLLVFDTDDSHFYFYHAASTTWISLTTASNFNTSVITDPASSTRNLIQPQAPGVVPFTVRGAVGQSANLLLVQNSTTSTLLSVDNAGALQFAGALQPSGVPGQSGYLLQSQGAATAPVWVNPATLFSVTSSSWSILGNTGTTGLNFLGTQDAQPLYIRTNNTTRATILGNGAIGIGTSAPQSALEISAAGSGLRFTNLTSLSSTNANNPGRILSVNASGDVVLVDDLQGTSSLPVGSQSGQTLRYNGSSWVTSSALLNDGTQVGINTTPSRTLDVNGTVRFGANGTTVSNIIKTTVSPSTAIFLNAGESVSMTLTVTGAATTATVAVSPESALPDGLLIAYTRVPSANTVEVRFRNVNATGTIVLPVMAYYVTVIE